MERFIFHPNPEGGHCLYDGPPVVDHSTYQRIGDAGVQQLQQAVADIICLRKRLLSISDRAIYGLPDKIIFYDMEKCLGLRLFYQKRKWPVSDSAIVGNQNDFTGLEFIPDDYYRITSSYSIKRGLSSRVFARRVQTLIKNT